MAKNERTNELIQLNYEKQVFDNERYKWMTNLQLEFYYQKCKEIDSGTLVNLNITLDEDKKADDKKHILSQLGFRIAKFEINSIDDVLKFEAIPRTMFMWGQQANNLKPAIAPICSSYFDSGDAKKLVYIQTLSDRPRYYLVRVDSGFDIDSEEDDLHNIEEVLLYLESIYGDCENIQYDLEDTDSEYTEEDLEFPTVDATCGWSWGEYKLDFSDWSLYE